MHRALVVAALLLAGCGHGDFPPIADGQCPRPAERPRQGLDFEVGLVANDAPAGDACHIRRLGPPVVRVEFDITAPVSRLRPAVERYGETGTRVLPLAGFEAVPGAEAIANLRRWAQELGPSGDAAVPIREIEFGNERSYVDGGRLAADYARAAAAAADALEGTGVGLLVDADDANTGTSTWLDGMIAAVPDLGDRVAGWVVHPYGPSWRARLDRVSAELERHGDARLWLTEYGIASDNGPCLDDNYGWDPCMSHGQAASALAAALNGMRDRLGDRLRAVFVYQGRDQRPHGATTRREHYFGATRHDGSRKGSYTDAVVDLIREPPG